MQFRKYHSGRDHYVPIRGYHQRQKSLRKIHKGLTENTIGPRHDRTRQLQPKIRGQEAEEQKS